MALTKVAGDILDPGIVVSGVVTATAFDGPFRGGSDSDIIAGIVTATGLDINGNGDISGNLVVGGNLTANGDFTTLNTTLREVELLRVDANNDNVAAGIITQTGSGDIFSAYDTSTEVFKIADGGDVGIARSIFHLNDIDTTIGFPAANQVKITAGNEVNTTFTSSTVNFNKKLVLRSSAVIDQEVSESSATVPTLRIRNTGNHTLVSFQNTNTASTIIQWNDYGNSTAAGNLIFRSSNGTAYEEHARFTGGGNFNLSKDLDVTGNAGIGSLSVAGIATFSNNIDAKDILINDDRSTTHGFLSIDKPDAGSATLKFKNNGSDHGYIQLTNGEDLHYYLPTSSTTSDHVFYTAGQQRVIMLGTGYVGIGTGNPSALLDVNKGTQANIQLKTTQPGSINSMSFAIGSSTNQIFSRGANTSTPRDFIFAQGSTQVVGIDTTGNITLKDTAAQGNSLVHFIKATDVNGASQYQLGMVSSGNQDLYLIQSKSANLRFQTNGSTRWKISPEGHLLPETAGAVNVGSATTYIGNVYIADDKKIFLGNDQDVEIYHTNHMNSSFIKKSGTGPFYFDYDGDFTIRNAAGSTRANFVGPRAQVELYHTAQLRLSTTTTGITVGGEVAATQDYPLSRPTLDLNFAAQKKLDPRITYQRTGVASFIDKFGLVKIVGENAPRFDHESDTGECKGLLIEESRTNLQPHSEQHSPDASDGFINIESNMTVDYDPGVVTPTGETTGAVTFVESGGSGQHYLGLDHYGAVTSGQTYTFSFFIKNISGSDTDNVKVITTTAAFPYMIRTFYFAGTNAGTTNNADSFMTKLPNGWWRCSFTATTNNNFSQTAFSIDFRGYGSGSPYDNVVALWGIQTELGAFPTSYIRTGNATSGGTRTRGTDRVEITEEEFSEFYNQPEGTIVSEIMIPSDYPITGKASVMTAFSDGSYNNRLNLASSTGSAAFNADVNIGSGTPTRASLGSYTSGSYSIKAAMAYKASDTAGSLNGAAAVTSSPSGTLPLLTRADIGQDHQNSNPLNGHMRRLMYYSRRLSNNQLRTLTS